MRQGDYMATAVAQHRIESFHLANEYFLEKQRFLLEILNHVQEPLLNEQWQVLARELVSDKAEYVIYNSHMDDFFELKKSGRLLPRDIYYSLHEPQHWEETLGLYYLFYYAREWSTLRQNICWARVHTNPSLFVYALTQALQKREDYRVLIMPKIFELLPEPYHDQQFVRQVRNFNFANWSRQRVLNSSDTEVKEAWPKSVLPAGLRGIRNTTEWSLAMAETYVLWIAEKRTEQGLEVLLGDIGWSAHWYYVNMGVMLTDKRPGTDQQLREWWYGKLSQILARYKLERYAQGLSYRRLSRMENQKTTRYLEHLLEYLETAVERAVTAEKYTLTNGTLIELRRDQNWLLCLNDLFPYDMSQLKLRGSAQPELISDLHTMLRAHNFYYYAGRLLRAFHRYRNAYLPSYDARETSLELRITNVSITSLQTYYEPVDADLNNALHWKHFLYNGIFMWQHLLLGRQRRLQQQPFQLRIQLTSNRTESIILRTFLTTMQGHWTQEPYFLLDAFHLNLNVGINDVTRDSRDFYRTVGDHITYTELYQYVRLAEKGDHGFPLNISTPNCGFPRRLLLPRAGFGRPLRMRLLVTATLYNSRFKDANGASCDLSNGVGSLDAQPWAFEIQEDFRMRSHIFWREVEIYHDNK
ncbi:larval serum protein 1 alpha chain [Scaptodrosophila lebanonensis]|uniref:Larval serum protein 1 alpha chain n=1 Tax=Drosophila lebanonensis TaxID=7225 RepID=A0A6J2T7U6_DROLE|nr:larval serum protein 1 alpha chain [Scaptodrosophila lebanonensis]